jgi:hypothetical protein
MRAMRAERFSGYEALKLVELPKPTAIDGKVLVRITAAGVTPLDHTILFGNFHIPEVRSNRSLLRRSLWPMRLRLCVISLKAAPLGGSSYGLTTTDGEIITGVPLPN